MLIPKNKKGAKTIQNFVIGFLIFSAVFAIVYLMANSMAEDYDETGIMKEEYSDTYNRFNETIYASGQGYRGLFDDLSDDNSGVLEILFDAVGVFKGFLNLIKITFGSVGVLDDVTSGFMEDIGMPETLANIVFPLISIIIAIVFIFAVINALNRGNEV